MKALIAGLLTLLIPIAAMQPPPKPQAQEQPAKEANKKQKKEECALNQFKDTDAKDDDWDDIGSDSHISDQQLARYKTRTHQSPADIAQSLKHNPDGWGYDSDIAPEIIAALESDSKDN